MLKCEVDPTRNWLQSAPTPTKQSEQLQRNGALASPAMLKPHLVSMFKIVQICSNFVIWVNQSSTSRTSIVFNFSSTFVLQLGHWGGHSIPACSLKKKSLKHLETLMWKILRTWNVLGILPSSGMYWQSVSYLISSLFLQHFFLF